MRSSAWLAASAGANHPAALGPEMLDKRGNEGERVAGVPILARQQPADKFARQRRFELAQFVGAEFVDLDAILAAQGPGEAILRQCFLGAVDVEMAALMDQRLGPGVARTLAHRRPARAAPSPPRPRLA